MMAKYSFEIDPSVFSTGCIFSKIGKGIHSIKETNRVPDSDWIKPVPHKKVMRILLPCCRQPGNYH